MHDPKKKVHDATWKKIQNEINKVQHKVRKKYKTRKPSDVQPIFGRVIYYTENGIIKTRSTQSKMLYNPVLHPLRSNRQKAEKLINKVTLH